MRELTLQFVRAPGPGGQNVNKVSSAVALRFDVRGSPTLPDAIKARLTALAGRRVNAEGMLVITAHRFRTQALNRRDAIERLAALLRAAAAPPLRPIATQPRAASKRKRLEDKRRVAERKRARRDITGMA